MKYISAEYSILMVYFHLQRHMGNFLIQVYGPCVLLVVLSWVSFWLNREATADRVSLGESSHSLLLIIKVFFEFLLFHPYNLLYYERLNVHFILLLQEICMVNVVCVRICNVVRTKGILY